MLKIRAVGLWSISGSRVYFWLQLLIAVARAIGRPSTREYRFIHIISAPLDGEDRVQQRKTWLYRRDVTSVVRAGSVPSKGNSRGCQCPSQQTNWCRAVFLHLQRIPPRAHHILNSHLHSNIDKTPFSRAEFSGMISRSSFVCATCAVPLHAPTTQSDRNPTACVPAPPVRADKVGGLTAFPSEPL
jgi:hypothetical protein